MLSRVHAPAMFCHGSAFLYFNTVDSSEDKPQCIRSCHKMLCSGFLGSKDSGSHVNDAVMMKLMGMAASQVYHAIFSTTVEMHEADRVLPSRSAELSSGMLVFLLSLVYAAVSLRWMSGKLSSKLQEIGFTLPCCP